MLRSWLQRILLRVTQPQLLRRRPAMAVILAVLASIVAFVAVTWNQDRASALMFLPYAAWVSFASLLNLSIAVLN